MLTLLTLAVAQSVAPIASQQANQQPNIVLIIADDVGTDFVGAYGEGNQVPCTPNIDGLAAEGMLFRNVWAPPLCSPTRATVLTGRHPFRHGIGIPLPAKNPGPGLLISEVTLPEILSGYESGAFGKWHLHGDLGNAHPNQIGFDHYAGSIGGGVPDYYAWPKITDGIESNVANYVVTETVDDALAAMQTMQEPWFLYVALDAVHGPFQVPPGILCQGAGCTGGYSQNLSSQSLQPELARAMMEVADEELGRLIDAVEIHDPNAMILFTGDNGTFGKLSVPPFEESHGKGTMYEGGVGVPLIVKGPGVVNAECGALVSLSDLFATVAELAGVTAKAEDSISLVPYFSDPGHAPLRQTLYSERFSPNHSWPKTSHEQAVRDTRYKLIRRIGAEDELYDLQADPFETQNLLPQLTPAEATAYAALQSAMTSLTAGVPIAYCTAGTSAIGCQAQLSCLGAPSASAASGFTIDGTGVEGGKDGLFFFGANGRRADPWGTSTSFQCVTPPLQRGGLQLGNGTKGACDAVLSQDLNARWQARPAQNPGAGSTVQVQLWYRDPQNPSNQTTSLSDALEVLVGP